MAVLQQVVAHSEERLPARRQVSHSRTVQAVVAQVIRVRRVAQGTGGVVRLVCQACHLPPATGGGSRAAAALTQHCVAAPVPQPSTATLEAMVWRGSTVLNGDAGALCSPLLISLERSEAA